MSSRQPSSRIDSSIVEDWKIHKNVFQFEISEVRDRWLCYTVLVWSIYKWLAFFYFYFLLLFCFVFFFFVFPKKKIPCSLNFCGSLILRTGDLLCFAETNFYDWQQLAVFSCWELIFAIFRKSRSVAIITFSVFEHMQSQHSWTACRWKTR